MADHCLSSEEAARVLAIIRATHTYADPVLEGALGKLALAADEPTPKRAPYTGLVVLNAGGVPEVVAGNVALVDFHSLGDPDSEVSAADIEQTATGIETDLGTVAKVTVSDLRELARTRRVERFQRDGTLEDCTAAQLSAVLAAADVSPEQVTVVAAERNAA